MSAHILWEDQTTSPIEHSHLEQSISPYVAKSEANHMGHHMAG